MSGPLRRTDDDDHERDEENDFNALEYWVDGTDVLARVGSYPAAAIEHARASFETLLNAGDESKVRALLASAKRGQQEPDSASWQGAPPDLAVLSDMLLLNCIDATERQLEQAENLIEWLTLVGEFAEDAELLSAHCQFLHGVLAISTSTQTDCVSAFGRALELYTQLAASPGLRSVAAFELAQATALDQDDPPRARSLFDEAEANGQEPARSAAHWLSLVRDCRSGWEARWRAMDAFQETADLQGALRTHPPDPELVRALQRRAITASAQGRVAQAIALATVVDRAGPELGGTGRFLLSLGEVSRTNGALDTAEAIARAVLTAESTRDDGQLLLSRVLRARGRCADAQVELEELVARSPEHAVAHQELGVVFFTQRRLLEALSAFGTAARLAPESPEVQRALMLLSPAEIPGVGFSNGTLQIDPQLFALGEQHTAVLITAAIVRSRPEAANEMMRAIEAEKGREFSEEVQQYLFPIHFRLPKQSGSALERAEALFQAARYEDARAEYLVAAMNRQDKGRALMGIGDCYYQQGKFNLAAAYFEESVLLSPDPSTNLFLGDAHTRAGRFEAAKAAYRATLDLNPQHPTARARLSALEKHDKHV
jgi:tetratricopeptide (TPR) repeat protein